MKSRILSAENILKDGEIRNAHPIIMRKPLEKWPLGRPRRRWEDNIRMDLRK